MLEHVEKSSQSPQVHSHIWFNSVLLVAQWLCKRKRGHGLVLKLLRITFWRHYVSCKVFK